MSQGKTYFFLFIFIIFPALIGYCGDFKDPSQYPLIHSLSVNLGADYVASSVEDDIREKIPSENKISIHSSLPVNFRYSFSFTNPHIPNYLPEGYQGIAIGILNFGGLESGGSERACKNIGFPVLTYIFQGGPFHHLSPKFSLNYEWNFGAAIGWKPYSESNKFFNLTVGSQVNAYLNLNLFLKWQLNKKISLYGGVAISHFSNGNTSFPNPGVNSLGIRIGMNYTFNPLEKKFAAPLPDTIRKRKLEFDITLWGSTRKRVYRGGENPVLLPGHFACAGLGVSPMFRLNNWWRVGGSADIQWDRSSDMKKNYIEGTSTQDMKFTTPNFFRQLSFGISAHGELKMPIFAVNIGMGYNILAPSENRGSYQNITLKTYLGSMVFLNVGYQLRNFHQQSSLMLGLGLTV